MVSYPPISIQEKQVMAKEEKKGFVGRLFRLVLWGVAAFFLFAVLLVAVLPLWISPVAVCVSQKVLPRYTGTDFSLGGFLLNPYSGTLRINGVKLSNPEGFGDVAAFSLSVFNVEVATGSVFSNVVVVKDVAIEDAFVSYYSHKGTNNFDMILANAKRTASDPQKGMMAAGESEKKPSAAKNRSDTSGKKVIIERLRISGTKVKLMKSDMLPPILLPTLELTDIGKKSGGATLDEAWKQIADAVMKSMAQLGDGIGMIGGFLGDGAKDFSAVLDGTASNAANGAANAVGDTAKKATEGVKNLFKGFGK